MKTVRILTRTKLHTTRGTLAQGKEYDLPADEAMRQVKAGNASVIGGSSGPERAVAPPAAETRAPVEPPYEADPVPTPVERDPAPEAKTFFTAPDDLED